MSVALHRANHRRIAQKALKTCATPNKEKPISGWLILTVCVLILVAAIVLDAPRAFAYVAAL